MSKTIKYIKVNKLNNEEFKRVTGVSRQTFALMNQVVRASNRKQRKKGGVKKKLAVNDQILMLLEYYRQYRTYKEISVDYGLSESNTYYTIKKIEDILIKDERFHLPSLCKVKPTIENDIDVIVIDVTESPCERPKKSKDSTIPVRKSDIL
jgi:hypothetical protein